MSSPTTEAVLWVGMAKGQKPTDKEKSKSPKAERFACEALTFTSEE